MDYRSGAEINQRIEKLRHELDKEKAELEHLAEECIKTGRSLASDENVLRQNRVVDTLVIKEHKLREMLKNYDTFFKKEEK